MCAAEARRSRWAARIAKERDAALEATDAAHRGARESEERGGAQGGEDAAAAEDEQAEAEAADAQAAEEEDELYLLDDYQEDAPEGQVPEVLERGGVDAARGDGGGSDGSEEDDSSA